MPVGTITFPTTIDSDQTLSGAANNVTVLLDQAINSTQTSIAVASTTFFPAAGFATIVDNLTTPTKIEIISYTQISGNTLQSVIRGAQGTTPQSFATGYVEIRPTAGHHLALVDAVIAIENRLGTGSTLSLTKGGTGRAFTTMPGTDRIFFWDASANSMQLLELGTNLSITGTVLNATGGAGPAADVIIGLGMPNIFSVTPASITNNGVFDVQFVSQTANTVLAGPTTGAAAAPAFRSLVAADIPALAYVTSVGLSLPSIFTVSNSPVTSSGTLTATLATQAENLVLVGPINAPAATPTFRLLEDEDIPNVLSIHKNRHLTTNGFVKTTNGDGTYAVDTNTYLTGNQTVTLSGDVTGSGATSITTTIANGAVTYAKIQNVSATSRVLGRKTAGAGSTEELTFSEVLDFVGSAAQGDILYRGSTGWARLAAGTNGQYLQTQGAAANPQWATVVAGGTPGGSSGQVQFNSASSFGGAAGFTYQSGASPNVTITAQNAAYVALSLVSASTPTSDVFRVSADNGVTTHFRITSTGSPSSPGATNSERFGAGSVVSSGSTGQGNTAIGANAACSTTNDDNTMVGAGSGSSGNNNSCTGVGRFAAAGISNNTGITAVGASAGRFCRGEGGTFIGTAAGQGFNSSNPVTGGSNTAIGNRAGYSLTSGTNNVYLGHRSGDPSNASFLVTGSNNTALGYFTNTSTGCATLSSTIAIGANASATASNQCVIGGANADGQINDMYIGSGVTFATPVNVTINASGGSGTNIVGADLSLAGGRGTGSAAGGVVNIRTAPTGSSGTALNALVTALRVDASTTATHTRLLVFDVDTGLLSRVTVGAADSGGTGFKVLRIPN